MPHTVRLDTTVDPEHGLRIQVDDGPTRQLRRWRRHGQFLDVEYIEGSRDQFALSIDDVQPFPR